MTKTLIRTKGGHQGSSCFNVDSIVGWTPDNNGNTATRVYLDCQMIVISNESSEEFEYRYLQALNNNVFIQGL